MKNLNKMKIAGDMQFEIGQDKVSHFPNLSVKDDVILHKKLSDMKHSTFDLSKFTVVGSPTITDDGIASEFSGISNYILANNIKLSNDFTIKIKTEGFKIVNDSIGLFGFYSSDSTFTDTTQRLRIDYNWGDWIIIVSDGTNTIKSSSSPDYIIQPAEIEITVKENIFTFDVKYTSGKTKTKSIDISSINKNLWSNLFLKIGSTAWSGTNNNSIDLKQFSITVDGKEVFTGNKTGIDTIFDNISVAKTGNPTITTDGILTSSDTSNYLKFNVGSLPASWSVENTVVTPSLPTTAQNCAIFVKRSDTGNNLVTIRIDTSQSKFVLGYYNSGGTYTNTVYNVTAYTKYHLKIEAQGSNLKIYVNGVTKVTASDLNTSVNIDFISIGCQGTGYGPWLGTLDLNTFKYIANGDIVYQPCLKIPYTESKTGSKIVDAIYRDRVIDMYEQFGYTHYYTIGENDFTLATCKDSDVVAQGEADGIAYTKTADLTLTQRGNCTSGSVVNLLPYKDENSYHVSAPHTAKTSNSFTPSIDGDFIAVGKCYL